MQYSAPLQSVGMADFIAQKVSFTILLFLCCGMLAAQTSTPVRTDSGTLHAAVGDSSSQPSADPVTGKSHDSTFIIGADDILAVAVWNEPEISSKSIPVRSDGKISLPLVGEVIAAGRTPLQLEHEISAKLRSYISEPQVTVIVEQINSEKFNILGQVNKPGSYALTTATTVVDAIALAGGFRDFAKKKGVYILRPDTAGGESRIAFNYQDFVKGKNTSQNVPLKAHDTIIVP